MQSLPGVQVKNLPVSASFYSAITQPLGLHFVCANAGSIVFGSPEPVFEVRTNPNPPQPTRFVLSVTLPSVVPAFYAAARRAYPKGNSNILVNDENGLSGESRASATDPEGNVMEIVYLPPDRAGSAARTKAPRVLDWNLDASTSSIGAARSVVSSASQSRPGLATFMSTPDEASYRYIRRSLTTSTVQNTPPPEKEESSKGITGAMMGMTLGAVAVGAIGAGLTYAFLKKERERAPKQEFEAPPFQRRATYPEPHPQHQPRYVELERTVQEKVRYPEQYPPPPNPFSQSQPPPQPSYTTRRPEPSNPPSPPSPPHPLVEDIPDDRARRPGPSSRSRAGSPPKPLMITETEHKSNVGSQIPEPPPHPIFNKSQLHAELFKKRERVPSHAPSRAPSQAPSKAPDARSHVSSRSRRDDDDDRRSHAGSRHHSHRHRHHRDAETHVSRRTERSSHTVVPAKSRSKGPSRAPSYVSAREIPTPPKDDDWRDLADDDDKASVAPSDSISCVGEERPSK